MESSVAQPAATFNRQFVYNDLYATAAALGHGLITSHLFRDGNRRTGGMAMLAFLAVKNLAVEIPEAAHYEMVIMDAKEGTPQGPDMRHRSHRLEVRNIPEERSLSDRAIAVTGTGLTEFVVRQAGDAARSSRALPI